MSVIFSYSCKKEDYIEPVNRISACGKEDPVNQLLWLSKKIYGGCDLPFFGSVWIKEYKGDGIIIIHEGLSDIWLNAYNCNSDDAKISDIDFFNSLADDDLIYRYP